MFVRHMAGQVNIKIDKADIPSLEVNLKNNLFSVPGRHNVVFDLSSMRFGLSILRASKQVRKTLEKYRMQADDKILSVEIRVSSKPLAALSKMMLHVLRPSHPTKVIMV